jgi:hypothetical protein
MRKLWIEDDITVRDGIGQRLVLGLTHVGFPGIAVTEVIGSPTALGWTHTITHVGSGLRCGPFFKNVRRAKQCLVALGMMADWTRDGDALSADKKVKARIRRYYRESQPYGHVRRTVQPRAARGSYSR